MLDAIEFLMYTAAFWRLVCSPRERERWVKEFRRAGLPGRCGMCLETGICAACGLLSIAVIPALLR